MKAPGRRDPVTGVQIERADVPVYMPGTPTASFMAYLELAVSTLFR